MCGILGCFCEHLFLAKQYDMECCDTKRFLCWVTEYIPLHHFAVKYCILRLNHIFTINRNPMSNPYLNGSQRVYI